MVRASRSLRQTAYENKMSPVGGKVALVTGGGRRIGAAISRALAKEGYAVVLTYRSARREASILAAEIGGKALRLDLARPAAFRRFADRLKSVHGRLDLLVHNAAVFPRTPLPSVTPAQWDAVFAVNLRGPCLLTRALLPLLGGGPDGAGVCFVGDAGARELWPSYLPYCLSKIALESFAAGLAGTLPAGIRVGVVRPGLVLPPPGFPETRWEGLRRGARRGIRTPRGVARAVLIFARGEGRISPHSPQRGASR
jgi:pteridine reductase